MAADMEGLSRAEEELQHLMGKLQQRDSKLELLELSPQPDPTDVMEVSRLREQASVYM
jgi:hypothetical protein